MLDAHVLDTGSPVYLDPYQFDSWLALAHPRAQLVYARCRHGALYSVKPLRRRVYGASHDGEVILAQRRIGPDWFEYVAIRASRDAPPKLFPNEA